MNDRAVRFVYQLIQMDRIRARGYETCSEQDISGTK
jgi:hypothetical protein